MPRTTEPEPNRQTGGEFTSGRTHTRTRVAKRTHAGSLTATRAPLRASPGQGAYAAGGRGAQASSAPRTPHGARTNAAVTFRTTAICIRRRMRTAQRYGSQSSLGPYASAAAVAILLMVLKGGRRRYRIARSLLKRRWTLGLRES